MRTVFYPFGKISKQGELLIVKVLLTILMICLGFYQATSALKKKYRINKKIIKLGFVIMLIAIGVVMSQINLPN